jgi:hypothetical protein
MVKSNSITVTVSAPQVITLTRGTNSVGAYLTASGLTPGTSVTIYVYDSGSWGSQGGTNSADSNGNWRSLNGFYTGDSFYIMDNTTGVKSNQV